MKPVSVTATTRTYPRTLPFTELKNEVLGKSYELSLIFVGANRARAINLETRKKTYVPNVLSFPLDTAHGEIYIAPSVAKREAKKFGLSEKGYIGFLFIHGLLHLKGIDHGTKMDTLEQKYLKKFGLR